MPQRIEVPGMGVVEFPDGMSDAQIAAAIQQNMGGGQPQPQQADRGVTGQLTGNDGQPRYQTWPERLVRGVGGAAKDFVALPGRVMQEAQQPQTQISDSDVSVMSVPQTMGAAAFASPINPAVRAGELAISGAGNAYNSDKWFSPGFKRDIPSAEQLKRTGGGQIEQARNSGVEFAPEAAQNLGSQIEAALQAKGFNDVTAKETFGTLAGLKQPPDGAVSATFGNLQNLREQLNKVAGSIDPREKAAANAAIKELDSWLSGNHTRASLAGSTTPEAAAQAAGIYKEGRGNYAAYKRSDDVTGRAEAADLRAAATNSGRNSDNLTRQRFVDILTNDAKGRGYSDPSLEAIEGLVRGGPVTNAARYTGNLLGGGGGLGQAITAGGAGVIGAAATGSPWGAALGVAPAAVGAAAKALANALTKRGVNKIDEGIRMESPMYQAMPQQAGNPTSQEALIRALLQMQRQQPQQ